MNKYIIKKTDLFYKGRLYPEGTKIELSDEDKQGLDAYLIPLTENNHSIPVPALQDGVESNSLPDLAAKTTNKKRNTK